jgi:hypothetical protein
MMVMSSGGVIYQAESIPSNGISRDTAYVSRVNERLVTGWRKQVSGENVVVLDIVPLDDGVLVLGLTKSSIALDPPKPLARRLDRNGEVIDMDIPLGGIPVQGIALGNGEVELLESKVVSKGADDRYEVARLRFDPLGSSAAPAGASCTGGADCASHRCCFSGSPSHGNCSADDKCGFSAVCSASSECSGGLCLPPLATGGVCTQSCAASQDCPAGSYCVSSCDTEDAGARVDAGTSCSPVCLLDCLSGGAALCTALHAGSTCAQAKNTEGVGVSVCR